jgi:hypothetical protein
VRHIGCAAHSKRADRLTSVASVAMVLLGHSLQSANNLVSTTSGPEQKLFRVIVVMGASLTTATACGSRVSAGEGDAARDHDAGVGLDDADSGAITSDTPDVANTLDAPVGAEAGATEEASGDSSTDDACLPSPAICCTNYPTPACCPGSPYNAYPCIH